MDNRKLRILFITWTFSKGGGAERVLSNLMCALGETGQYDLSLLEVSHDSISWEPLPVDTTVLPPALDETNNAIFYRLRRFLLRKAIDNGFSLARSIVRKGQRYDVVVSFNYLYPTFLVYRDETSISWNHGAIDDLKERPKERELQRQSYKWFDAIVAIAQRTKDSIIELFPEYAYKLHVIPNGFRFDVIREKSLGKSIELSGVPILAIGRLDENKDPLRILEVFNEIHSAHPECHLYYLGDGGLRDKLAQAITRSQLDECVTLLGYQQNPYPLIRQSSCILTMSKSEGFQTIIVEGLALGVPFISTPVGSAEELSCNGSFGKVICSPAEAQEAYDALITAKNKGGWHERITEFVEQYSLEKQVESFEALVAKVTEGKTSHE